MNACIDMEMRLLKDKIIDKQAHEFVQSNI